jgi:hypothetical protein
VFSAISSVGERYNYDCLEKIIDSTITELMAIVSPRYAQGFREHFSR